LQTPAPFEYERATTVDEAIASLEAHGPEARVIAGGHSLLPMMKLRLAKPEYLVDINELRDLEYIEEEGGEIRIGALTRHVDLLKSELLAQHFPIFGDAEQVIADPVVRNRGTIGGALCQADPAEDLSAVCAAVGARMVIRGRDRERVVGMDRFHQGPYATAVGPAEMLTEIRVPLRAGAGSAYTKVGRRVGDWAVVAAGAAVELQDDTIARAGLALVAAGGDITASAAEDALTGEPPSAALFARAGAIAARTCDPVSDQRGSAEYKRHVVGVLTERVLARATERARQQRER
jgi:aerobic carbon-monoxide dehydrogenase medium subunit